MLMASVPRLDKKWEDGAEELKAKRTGPASGCVYYERWPLAFDKCRKAPPLTEIEKDRFVACWKGLEKRA
jgi:ABC-type dipeptide/oligopeptide/nickel transport system ATPase component